MFRHDPLEGSRVPYILRLLWNLIPDLPGSKLLPIFWPHQCVHTKVQTHTKFLHKLISKIGFLHNTVIRTIGKCCNGNLAKTTPDHGTVCNNLTCFPTGLPAVSWCYRGMSTWKLGITVSHARGGQQIARRMSCLLQLLTGADECGPCKL